MAGLGDLVAAEHTETIGGVEYTFTPATIRDRQKIEQRILDKRGDPVAIARRLAVDATPEERERMFDRAYQDAAKAQQVTAEEMAEFETAADGAVFSYWLSLRQHHPDLTEDEAAVLLEKQLAESLTESIAEIKKQYPEATPEDITKAIADVEGGVLGELIGRISGMPAGNLPSPATKPGTQPSDPSPGNDGSDSSAGSGN